MSAEKDEARSLGGGSGSGAHEIDYTADSVPCADSRQVPAAEVLTVQNWTVPEPLTDAQSADVAALLRESRHGQAADLLMSVLGFRPASQQRVGV